ncbi:MAG: LytTR family DNA-binding domain-containing protein [Bacteroidota bacterium]
MKALIVDDIRLARQELIRLLKNFTEVEIVGEASNAEEARDLIQGQDPDLLFLDIQMPEEDGFSLLESIDDVPDVIFTTAFHEYALKAFENNALDYLVKPIDPDRLAAALEKYTTHKVAVSKKALLDENSKVFVKDGERCWFVKLADVRFFETFGNYSRIHFNNEVAMVGKSLNYLESRLDPTKFFRASRQYIVHLEYVEEVIPWFSDSLRVRMTSGEEIDISRRRSVKFKELLSF